MYKDCDVPAKLFFKIINTGDKTLLGEGTPEEQNQAFDDIFDEYYNLDTNKSFENIYRRKAKIELLNVKIQFISDLLYILVHGNFKSGEKKELVKSLNNIDGVKVNFKYSDDYYIFTDEILRVHKQVIGSLKNQLNIEISNEKKSKSEEKTIIKFENDLVSISRAVGFHINPEISLREYVAYKQTAIQIHKANKIKK